MKKCETSIKLYIEQHIIVHLDKQKYLKFCTSTNAGKLKAQKIYILCNVIYARKLTFCIINSFETIDDKPLTELTHHVIIIFQNFTWICDVMC